MDFAVYKKISNTTFDPFGVAPKSHMIATNM